MLAGGAIGSTLAPHELQNTAPLDNAALQFWQVDCSDIVYFSFIWFENYVFHRLYKYASTKAARGELFMLILSKSTPVISTEKSMGSTPPVMTTV